MHSDLREILPALMPSAIAWAENVARNVAETGTPLHNSHLRDASSVGVQRSDRIRVLTVDRIPRPEDVDLRTAALEAGLLGPTTTGLTLVYSILICHGHMSRRTLSHEFRHVAQFENAGSIASFLPVYLDSIIEFGYWESMFEQDARKYEIVDT